MNVHLTIHKGDTETVYTESRNTEEWLNHKIALDPWFLGKVFLISIHNDLEESLTTEILVTESKTMARGFVDDWFATYYDTGTCVAHVMEFDSYEDAYAVALSMREIQPNCYDNEDVS